MLSTSISGQWQRWKPCRPQGSNPLLFAISLLFLCGAQMVSVDNVQTEGREKEQGSMLRILDLLK